MLIDSSGPRLVCAVAVGGRILAEQAADARGPDIGAVVTAAMEAAECSRLEGIVAGLGPGSFIGTRTALSFANGYAAASGVPLYGVNSLAALAAAEPGPVAVLRDARRRQWYLWLPDGEPRVLSADEVPATLASNEMTGAVIELPESADPDPTGGEAPALAAKLQAAGVAVSLVNSVPAAGLLRAAEGLEPRQYLEPVYLRGVT